MENTARVLGVFFVLFNKVKIIMVYILSSIIG